MAVMLKHKALNKWNLFWLISLSLSAIMVFEMLQTDLSTGEGVSHMIGFSVRFAVPIIFLVAAISALHKLLPGPVPAWLLRNRKYIGLCFAVAMAWQGLFIFIMSYFKPEYYYEEVFFFRDELEGTTGYLFLTAMVVTSFDFGRKRLSPQQWRLIHLASLYFLWAYAFSVYWWNLSYYPNPQPYDYVFYVMGFTAFTLRIVAWGKGRVRKAVREVPDGVTPDSLKALGGVLMGLGLFYAVWSLIYQEEITAFLNDPEWSANLTLWLPYWPFEPYLSLMLIGLGTLLTTTVKDKQRVPAH